MKLMKPHLHPTVEKYVTNPDIALGYDEYFMENRLFNFDCQFLASCLKPPGKILDAGCGTGRHLVFLHKLGFEVTGLDLSKHFLQKALLKLQDAGVSHPHLVHGDIISPPKETGRDFDTIILMFSVLGMIQGNDNRLQALVNLKNLLKPGGKILAHFHNREYRANPVIEKIMRIRRVLSKNEALEEGDSIMRNYRGLQDLYLHAFTLKEVNILFKTAGLSKLRITTINHERTGCYKGNHPRRESNGFLLSATK